MGLLGQAKKWINRGIAPFNVRLESRTAERIEGDRLRRLSAAGYFDRPAFPLLRQFEACDPTPIVEAVAKYDAEFDRIGASGEAGGFRFDNAYFQSPDAEVLYAMVRLLAPRRIVEVGSGHSTMLFRQAIADGSLDTRVTCIDPSPRLEVTAFADEWIPSRLEDLSDVGAVAELSANDILFVDSSHEIKSGNDVIRLFLTIIPGLAPGVVVHVHDVFLPYDYPELWVVQNRWTWTEQYLLQAMLHDSHRYEVLWCGHYLQRTRPDLMRNFRHWRGSAAGSVWMRKRAERNAADEATLPPPG